MFVPKEIVAPAYEPLSLTEIKAQLRIDGSTQDAELARFAKAARRMFQKDTGITLYETTWLIALECWPCGPIVLPRAAPLLSVEWVKYTDSDGVQHTWSSSEYDVDTYDQPGRIAPKSGYSYPSSNLAELNPILVQYRAGIDDSLSPLPEVDEDIRLALLLLVGSMNENRESELISERVQLTPYQLRIYTDIVNQRRVAYAF